MWKQRRTFDDQELLEERERQQLRVGLGREHAKSAGVDRTERNTRFQLSGL